MFFSSAVERFRDRDLENSDFRFRLGVGVVEEMSRVGGSLGKKGVEVCGNAVLGWNNQV